MNTIIAILKNIILSNGWHEVNIFTNWFLSVYCWNIFMNLFILGDVSDCLERSHGEATEDVEEAESREDEVGVSPADEASESTILN